MNLPFFALRHKPVIISIVVILVMWGLQARGISIAPLPTVLLALPVGIGLLSLQYLADILALLTGRDMPFGIERPRP